MSRATYVMRNGELVEKSQAAPLGRSNAPQIISDYLPEMRHPITNELMDSKSRFRAITRAHGCVEVGNDQQTDRRTIDLGDRKRDIARAIEQLGG